ncbi:hypothetical protein [Actinoplanes sp. NBRC 103695]|uniref:MmyB family transcriptional regulator n=1 Tax=Actinoplanes sp. NBRC 103695 TaxID=3032202 RepID=UPI0024A1EFC4|nr:hypothetical protein [Actinoplanes sp. NBRC 103695]GLY94049.1 hypothetical protein Acsp02_13050 [Actinoplanes sp. NBRC 103695]
MERACVLSADLCDEDEENFLVSHVAPSRRETAFRQPPRPSVEKIDEAEHQHLTDLARTIGRAARPRRRPPAAQVRRSVTRVLELLTDVPAFVGNGRGDILTANPLAEALYAPMFDDPVRPVNHARFVFLRRPRPAHRNGASDRRPRPEHGSAHRPGRR